MNVNTHVIYFDVETQRSAQEVGGWNYVERLGLALAVIYDTRDNNYRIYDEASVANMEAVKPNIKKRKTVSSQNLSPISSREEITHKSDEVFAEASQRKSKVTVVTRAGYVLRGYIQFFDRDALYMRISGRFVIVYRHGILEFQNGIV